MLDSFEDTWIDVVLKFPISDKINEIKGIYGRVSVFMSPRILILSARGSRNFSWIKPVENGKSESLPNVFQVFDKEGGNIF